MTTLNLKKRHKGIYTLAVEHESIEIDLSNHNTKRKNSF